MGKGRDLKTEEEGKREIPGKILKGRSFVTRTARKCLSEDSWVNRNNDLGVNGNVSAEDEEAQASRKRGAGTRIIGREKRRKRSIYERGSKGKRIYLKSR